MKKGFIVFLVWVCLLAAALWYHASFVETPASASSSAPEPSAFPTEDFDFAKRDRETDWCLAHGGVPTMTFTHAHSNVLCLQSAAVIPLPSEK